MLSTVGRFIYTKYWGILYVEHRRNIYLHKILGITLCWTLWEYLCTQNTGDYFMLNTVGRFIYTKYWGILYVEHCGKIYLHKIQRNNVCLSTVGRFIYTKYWGILYVEHCGQIYLHKILRNTVCWTPWEYLFTQNTEEHFMLSIVGRIIYTKYWGILYVEHCGKIYLHKILRNTVCWTPWEYLFTQNTEEYFMLSTVGRFIYTKYLGLLLVEHCRNIYLHKILGNTLCWTLGIFIYTKYWGILYVEHCGKIYLHKILRNTVCWAP
jgi:hypothetical protein